MAAIAAAGLLAGLVTVTAGPAGAAPGDPSEVTTIAGGAAGGDLREIGLQPTGMVVADGRLYVADLRGTVRAVDPGTRESRVVAGVGAWTSGPPAALATEMAFNNTMLVENWRDGKLLVQEQCGVVSLDPETHITERVAGTCDESAASSGEDGTPATGLLFPYINDVIADREDILFLGSSNLRRIDGDTELLETLTTYVEDPLPGLVDGVTLDEAYFNGPRSLAWLPDGDLLISEDFGNRLRVVDSQGDGIDRNDPVTTLSGDATKATGSTGNGVGDGGPAVDALLNRPGEIAVLSDGRIVVIDAGSQRVRLIGADGARTIDTIAGGGAAEPDPENPGPVDATTLRLIGQTLAVTEDTVYVGSQNQSLLFELDLAADPITASIVGGDGSAGFAGDGRPATAAQLHQPKDVAVAPDGAFVVADSGNNRVRRIADGTITTVAGNGRSCGWCIGETGHGTERALDLPSAVAVAGDGTIYWANGDQPSIFALNPADGSVRPIAGTGDAGSVDGDATFDPMAWPPAEDAATFGYHIGGLVLSPDEQHLYVADTESNKVRRVELTGADPQVTTVAGNGFSEFFGDDGPAIDAQLNPQDVAFLPDGDLLVADGSNYRVRRIDAETQVISTVMGTGIDPGLLEDPESLDLEEDGQVVAPLDANVYPVGLDVREDGTYAVAGDSKVWLVDATGARRVLGHQTKTGYSGDAGPGVEVWANGASAVAFTADGSLLVADTYSNRVRKVDTRTEDPTGPITPTITVSPVTQVYGKAAKLSVTLPSAATGTVNVTVGSTTVTAPLSGGNAVATLPARRLNPGSRTVTVSYDGLSGQFTPATKTVPVKVVKATPRVTVRGPSKVRRGKTATIRVTVAAAGVTPAGKVTVKLAGKTRTVKLNKAGKATIKVKVARSAKLGKKTLSVSYRGNTYVSPGKAKATKIRVTR